MFGALPTTTYYLICYELRDGKRYIHNVDMDADAGSRTRIWTSVPQKAYRFKEQVDAELVAEMFFDANDTQVEVVAWPVHPHPWMFGYPNV